MMLPSGNDAANVLAETVSGSIPKFIQELNDFLSYIGCKNTHFCNPHGLSDIKHTTTAIDLATMARYAMRNEVFKQIVSAKKFYRPKTNYHEAVVLPQLNGLVKPKSKHFYPYATGLKTGYTALAGNTIVASADNGERSLIAVVCHREGAAKRYRSVVQLFEAAFNEKRKSRTLFAAKEDLFQHPIKGASHPLKARLDSDVVVTFFPSEEKKFHSEIQWETLSLPIQEKTHVGTLYIYDEKQKLQTAAPLLSTQELKPSYIYIVKEFLNTGGLVKKSRVGLILGGFFLALGFLIRFKGRWKSFMQRKKIAK